MGDLYYQLCSYIELFLTYKLVVKDKPTVSDLFIADSLCYTYFEEN